MGLDISAYSHLQYVAPEDEDCEQHWNQGHLHLYDIGFGRLAGQHPGWYAQTVRTEVFHFRAGSYSGYNAWRAHLCQAVLHVEPSQLWHQPGDYHGRPFVELINFSDCEGTLGAVVSEKLRRDCVQWLTIPDITEWHRAFILAAQGGAVCFH